jgi:hypothetical protein
MKLITLEQAKLRCRIDADEADTDIDLMIEGASHAVLNYLKSGADYFLDTNGEVPLDTDGDPDGVPAVVQNATLLMLGYLYRYRDENPNDEFQMGYLPAPVMSLLYPLRDPALA